MEIGKDRDRKGERKKRERRGERRKIEKRQREREREEEKENGGQHLTISLPRPVEW